MHQHPFEKRRKTGNVEVRSRVRWPGIKKGKLFCDILEKGAGKGKKPAMGKKKRVQKKKMMEEIIRKVLHWNGEAKLNKS